MLKRTARVLGALLVVIGLYVALLASELLPRPSSREAEAVALAERPLAALQGRSGLTTMWYLPYDLGGRDPEELLREDERRLLQSEATGDTFVSVAADFPKIEMPLPTSFCPVAPERCLDHVRHIDDHGAAELAEHAVFLRRLGVLADADHFRYPLPITDQLPLALVFISRPMRMVAAHRFVAESPAAGLAQACRDLALLRRLTPSSDLLISRLVMSHARSGAAALIAEMLEEWPAAEALPEPCGDALAPIAAAEADACDSWRGEYRYMALTTTSPPPGAERPWAVGLLRDLGINARAERARAALVVAGGCGHPYAPEPPDWSDWAFNPIGTLDAEHNRYYPDYFRRLEDDAAVLQAVSLLAWLRAEPDPAAALAAVPAERGARPARLSYDESARSLILIRGETDRHPEIWEFPLPPPSQLPASPPAG